MLDKKLTGTEDNPTCENCGKIIDDGGHAFILRGIKMDYSTKGEEEEFEETIYYCEDCGAKLIVPESRIA